MKYNISKNTAPEMPNLGKGTEFMALLLSQVSKDMQKAVVPMIFPLLGAHVSGAEFMYSDLSWKEMSGMLANLVTDSGAGKGQLSALVEAMCRDLPEHDETELEKLVEWQRMVNPLREPRKRPRKSVRKVHVAVPKNGVGKKKSKKSYTIVCNRMQSYN